MVQIVTKILRNYVKIIKTTKVRRQADQVRMLAERLGCSNKHPSRSDMPADRPGQPIG
ncbi:hypothetical protein Hanom_Chr12g01127941 [Helianthus anomalus]